MEFSGLIKTVGEWVDLFGVAVIIVGVVLASVYYLMNLLAKDSRAYVGYRKNLGKSLLLGLELLVAADIIRTVAVQPTLESVVVLAIIVIIRTFLSWSLEVEIEGRWPWQHPGNETEKTL